MDQEAIKSNLQQSVEFQFSRSSGPGGQNVNKVNTKVSLSWTFKQADWLNEKIKAKIEKYLKNRINNDGQVVIYSQKYRTQTRNMEDCLDKLAELLLPLFQETKVRRPTKPSRGAKERRLKEKKVRSERKQGRGKIDY